MAIITAQQEKITIALTVEQEWIRRAFMGTAKYYAFKEKTATIDGVTKTWAEWCKEKGISRKTVYYRIKAGKSFETAISRKSLRGDAFWEKEITHNNVTLTASEWASYNGISRQCWHSRVHKLGMTPEDAVLTPVGRRGIWINPETDLTPYINSRFVEEDLSLHPTPEVVEMCTNCKHKDCNGTITKCLRNKRRKEMYARENSEL